MTAPLYTPELGREIIRRMASGESLLAVTRDKAMPCRATVNLWLASEDQQFAEFQKAVMLVRRGNAHFLADEIIEISDDTARDTLLKETKGGDEYETPNHEWITRSKLRVDSRKFLMSKFAPEMFGESMQLTGANGGPIEIKDDSNRRDLARTLAFAMALGLRAKKALAAPEPAASE